VVTVPNDPRLVIVQKLTVVVEGQPDIDLDLTCECVVKYWINNNVVCALRHLIHIVLLGYLLCYSVRCYIQVRPNSCTISIFPANPALAAFAWQNVIGRRQLSAKSKVGAPVSNLTDTLLTLLLIRELNVRQKTERFSSVSALSGRWRCSLLLATVFPLQSTAAINRLP